jgi:hypothetical protein
MKEEKTKELKTWKISDFEGTITFILTIIICIAAFYLAGAFNGKN